MPTLERLYTELGRLTVQLEILENNKNVIRQQIAQELNKQQAAAQVTADTASASPIAPAAPVAPTAG